MMPGCGTSEGLGTGCWAQGSSVTGYEGTSVGRAAGKGSDTLENYFQVIHQAEIEAFQAC
jgi:hypothetical protein